MFSVNIKLNSIDKARQFVVLMQQFDPTIFLIAGDRSINAKSILGIFSMDLTKPMKLLVETENADEFKPIYKCIEPFVTI